MENKLANPCKFLKNYMVKSMKIATSLIPSKIN